MFTSGNLLQLWKISIFHSKIQVNHLTNWGMPFIAELPLRVVEYSQKNTQLCKPVASKVPGVTADQDLNEDFASKPQGNWVFLEGLWAGA